MTQRILVLSGKKQAGKSTASNFLHGYIMKEVGATKFFDINDDGKLLVYSEYNDEEGAKKSGMGIFDLDRQDETFTRYLYQRVWPYVKAYSFADELKHICITVFGLTYEQCYGTDEEKNSYTNIKWSDISFALPPRQVGQLKKSGKFDEFLTGREFMQQFGTNICRKIFNDCWVQNCYNRIVAEGVPLAIVTDGRFPNEIDGGDDYDVRVIRFTRSVDGDSDGHDSEKALDKYEWNPDKHYVMDNSEMTIKEQNQATLSKLVEWGWIAAEV